MDKCPACGSTRVYPSRHRSTAERLHQVFTEKRPYRCRRCNWRGWLIIDPSEVDRAARRSTVPDPPNLKGTLLARADAQRSMDLKDLDRFHSVPDKDDA